MKKKYSKILPAALFLLFIFSNCGKSAAKQSDESFNYNSFRDVPGITAGEIRAIEAFQEQNISFVYGMTETTEAFYAEDGEVGGFAALFCEWLTSFFGIPFIPAIYLWDDLGAGLASGSIDFSGELTATDERRKTYYMTDAIASRPIKYFRIENSTPLWEIALARPVRYAIINGTTTVNAVLPALTGDYEIIFADNNEHAYVLLKSRAVDAFIDENAGEASFDLYGDVVIGDFFPMVSDSVSMSTQNPQLEPVISIVQKMLSGGGIRYLVELYNRGYRDYMRHKMRIWLTSEEREYIKNHPVIKIAAKHDLYPISFYNTRENAWQGIFFDLLDEIAPLTGLSFELAHDRRADQTAIYQMLLNGEVAMVSELTLMDEREDLLCRPAAAIQTDYLALISKMEFHDITINEVPYVKVGVIRGTAYTAMFNKWFPNHMNTIEYENWEGAFGALQRDEVDVVMETQNRLLYLTNYRELTSYKINLLFDYPIENKFGFSRNEAILCSIIDKALRIVDTGGISNQWMRKTFDYRAKVAEARQPPLIGATFLFFCVIVLLFMLFRKTSRENERLEVLMQERASDLITAIAETEKANERTTVLFDAMPLCCNLWDKNINLLDCNNETLRLFNVPDKQTFIDRFYEFAPEYQPDGRSSKEVAAEKIKISFEKGFARFEWLHQKLNGELIPTEIISKRIKIGNEYAIAAYIRDLREYKAMLKEIQEIEDDLRHARDIAEESSKAKSKFLATMSHEIRTPMNSIVGFSELALDDKIPEKTRDYLNRIMLNSEWLLQIINDILDISKIESGKMELEKIPFDLHELFTACHTIITPKAEEKGIALYFYAEPSIGKKLLGDPIRLRQILLNMLSNAVKFTNMGGTVKISATVNGLPNGNITIHFEIRDTGIGMTAEQIEKITEPFTQADTDITRKYGGTGLGLAISRNFIEMMGGVLTIESTPGVGSKFSFEITFDTIESAENNGDTFTDGTIDKPLFDGEVLLCEDNQMNQQLLREHLKRIGLTADIAENGREGFNMVKRRSEKNEKPYDLIFMDIYMPVMDGIEAAALINKLHTGTPIVAMTANVMAHDRELYLKNGMQDCVGKPFVSQELWRCLLKYLTPVKLQAENKAKEKHSDEKLRDKLITHFVKDNQNRYGEIASAIDSGDIKKAHRLAHALKSNAALLEKNGLQKIAADVEYLLKDGENLVTAEHLNSLKRELSAALNELAPLAKENAPPQAVKPLDAEEARELFAELKPLLDAGNLECLKYEDKLRGIPGSEQLIQQMEDFDFKAAAKTLTLLFNLRA